jgi:hypothetical protein
VSALSSIIVDGYCCLHTANNCLFVAMPSAVLNVACNSFPWNVVMKLLLARRVLCEAVVANVLTCPQM